MISLSVIIKAIIVISLRAVAIRIQTENRNRGVQKFVPVTPNLWPFVTLCDICDGHKWSQRVAYPRREAFLRGPDRKIWPDDFWKNLPLETVLKFSQCRRQLPVEVRRGANSCDDQRILGRVLDSGFMQARVRLGCSNSSIYTDHLMLRRHASPPRAAAVGVNWTLVRSPREDFFRNHLAKFFLRHPWGKTHITGTKRAISNLWPLSRMFLVGVRLSSSNSLTYYDTRVAVTRSVTNEVWTKREQSFFCGFVRFRLEFDRTNQETAESKLVCVQVCQSCVLRSDSGPLRTTLRHEGILSFFLSWVANTQLNH